MRKDSPNVLKAHNDTTLKRKLQSGINNRVSETACNLKNAYQLVSNAIGRGARLKQTHQYYLAETWYQGIDLRLSQNF